MFKLEIVPVEKQATEGREEEKVPVQTVYKDFFAPVLQKDLSVCY